MAKKEKGITRVDLRIPDEIFTQIETIAENNGMDFTPTTKPDENGNWKKDKQGNVIKPKRAVTPVILDLLKLGLRAIAQDEGLRAEEIGTKKLSSEIELESSVMGILQNNLSDLLATQLEELIEKKLVERMAKLPVKPSPIETTPNEKLDNSHQNPSTTPHKQDYPAEVIPSEELLEREQPSDDSTQINLELNPSEETPSAVTVSDIKSEVVSRDNEQPTHKPIPPELMGGLKAKELAKRFKTPDEAYVRKLWSRYKKDYGDNRLQKFKEKTKELDPEGFSWYRTEDEATYYVYQEK
ncbi:hypothetical protein A5482_014525 (plasmid) [Cyanobacterium sp. IPPAS B-1200]|uniref:hypothetical protein n=1 Tax=Cyanobacterium sp. IPPAS B-1200 TaxID=1562720 RepID=UPI0008526939|nr:hypothetical protein [Cyanobacterium sp. IPPAS B-1200]OEJ78051.1 hypothetical protein A5482_14425 [Cyanobacterium sp. IPPAS B-1200]